VQIIKLLIDIFLHLDKNLNQVITQFGQVTYLLLFIIIFCETGLVITPFLPGDSLIFAAGTFAASGSLNIWILFFLINLAAILGDTVNYWIGHFIGPKVFEKNYRFLKREHLEKTHKFYEKYGGKTIILARFIPIIRTFAPFVAGVGKMTYWKFISYNIAGGILWVSLFTFGGYFFGNIPIIKKNFHIAILAIVFLSVLPAIFEYLRHKKSAMKIV
jgi:membrane-associated protein